jgi:hypothetical protein
MEISYSNARIKEIAPREFETKPELICRNAYEQTVKKENLIVNRATAKVMYHIPDDVDVICIESEDTTVPTVAEILTASGLNMTQLSKRFKIPYKTIQHWVATGNEHRECPVYIRLMMQEILGLL